MEADKEGGEEMRSKNARARATIAHPCCCRLCDDGSIRQDVPILLGMTVVWNAPGGQIAGPVCAIEDADFVVFENVSSGGERTTATPAELYADAVAADYAINAKRRPRRASPRRPPRDLLLAHPTCWLVVRGRRVRRVPIAIGMEVFVCQDDGEIVGPLWVEAVISRRTTHDDDLGFGQQVRVTRKKLFFKSFKPSETKNGITVKFYKGQPRVRFKTAFADKRTGGNIFRRRGKKRLPINKMKGPTPVGVLSRKNAEVNGIRDDAGDQLQSRFASKIEYEISKLVTRSQRK